MKQTDDELARRLAKLLDQGANELDPGAAARLAAARRQALARYEAQPAPAWQWAPATSSGSRSSSDSRRMGMRLLLAAVLVAAVAIGLSWQSGSNGPDIAEIDAALLTDELPINAFLDQGFDSWLKRGSR
jgi:hypothetical protein